MQNDSRVIEVAHFKYMVIIGIGIGIYHTTIKKPQHAGLWGHFPLVQSIKRCILPNILLGDTSLHGSANPQIPGSENKRIKSCVLLPAAGRRTQLFHLIFTEPGPRGLADPCSYNDETSSSIKESCSMTIGQGRTKALPQESSLQRRRMMGSFFSKS